MRRKTQIFLLTSFTTVFLSLAISSTVTGQTTDIATISPTTVSDCDAKLATALTRLDKALDAYEKAIAVIGAKDTVIAGKDAEIALHKQYEAIKDQMIAAQADLIKFYEKSAHGTKSKLRKVFERIEKVLIFIGGAYIGKGI